MEGAILFVNATNEDFTHSWGGISYTFKVNQPMYLEQWKAEHFAKHLIDREINKMNIGVKPEKEIRLDNQMLRKSFAEKFLKVVETNSTESSQLASEILDKNLKQEEVPLVTLEKKPFCDTCPSRGVRHRKECPKYVPIEKKS